MLILIGGYVIAFMLVEIIDISMYVPCDNTISSKVRQLHSGYG